MQTIDLKDRIATEVVIDSKNLPGQETAIRLCDRLQQRGVLVCKELNLSDEQQVSEAGMMGNVREEGEREYSRWSWTKEPMPGEII